MVLRGWAWISHWNCVCSLARLFFDVPKLLQPLNNLLMAANFSELLLRSFVLCHIHCQTLCSNFEEWVTKSPVPFFWKLPWEANTSTTSNLNQWSVFHWCSTILWAPYELWKHMGVSENVVYPIVPNGFADHYPVFKWLYIIGNINPTFSGPKPYGLYADFFHLRKPSETLPKPSQLWTMVTMHLRTISIDSSRPPLNDLGIFPMK